MSEIETILEDFEDNLWDLKEEDMKAYVADKNSCFETARIQIKNMILKMILDIDNQLDDRTPGHVVTEMLEKEVEKL